MNITFTHSDLNRFCLILYVVTWLVFFCCLNLYSQKKNVNVHKVYRWYFITVFTRHWGWFLGLLIAVFLRWIFPTVQVISQNPERTRKEKKEMADKWSWCDTTYTLKETFYIDEYYVPFSFGGHFCSPFNSYLFNNTDSTLVVYSTEFYNGIYNSVSDVNQIGVIPPQYFKVFEGDIINKFDTPREYTYISKKERNKNIWELTINFKSDAILDIERIKKRIPKWSVVKDSL